jgi:acyl dehydratase
VELRWRRPFFAGERARLGMRLVAPEAGDAAGWKIGAVGAFRGEGPKPSSAVKMWFR